MTPDERSDREEAIFDEALSTTAGELRDRLLDTRCHGDIALRERVLALIRAYEGSQELELPIVESLLLSQRAESLVGSRVGRFDVLELLGEGGMGDVYFARDSESPEQLVAVKVIKAGMNSRQVLARFELERKSLRALNHPHIARWIDAGMTSDNRPFVAMELVRGLPITDYCDRECLTLEDRIRLMIDACSAVEYAHQQRLVHRDLKPWNILVGRQADRAYVKVIDFGVAKVLDPTRSVDTRYTMATHWIGTPCYVSPEQSRWSTDVDVRTDVYSLGAILYELWTGTPPLEPERVHQMDLDELRQAICDDIPLRPSRRVANLSASEADATARMRDLNRMTLIRSLRGDLDWITLKALEKAREQRYASVRDLSDDLRAVLEHRRPSAGPPRISSQVGRWARGHRQSLWIATCIGLLSCLLVGYFTLQRLRDDSRRSEEEFQRQQRQAELELASVSFAQDIRSAAQMLENGDSYSARPLLDKWRRDASPFRDRFVLNYLRARAAEPLESWQLHEADLLDMDMSPDGRWIASSDRAGDIVIWNVKERRESHRLRPSAAEVTRVRFSPDGQFLASAGQDRSVRIWNVADGSPAGELLGHEVTINGLAWSPDGKKIASGDRDGLVHIWDVADMSRLYTLEKHTGPVRCLTWSGDGRWLATADGNRGVYVWETVTWTQKTFLDSEGRIPLAIGFSPDMRQLAFGGYGDYLTIADVETGLNKQRVLTQQHIWSVVWEKPAEIFIGQHGGLVAVVEPLSSSNGWEIARRVRVSPNPTAVYRSIVSRDADSIWMASDDDRTIRVLPKSMFSDQLAASDAPPIPVRPVHQSNRVIVIDPSRDSAEVRQVSDGAKVFHLDRRIDRFCRPAYCEATGMMAIAEHIKGTVFAISIVDGRDGRSIHQWAPAGRPTGMSFSRDGRYLAVSDVLDAVVHVIDLQTFGVRRLESIQGNMWAVAAFSHHRDVLVGGAGNSDELLCFDARTFQLIRKVKIANDLFSIEFFPQSDRLVVGERNSVSVWTGDLSRQLWSTPVVGHAGRSSVERVAVSPDESTIVAMMESLHFFDCQTHSLLFEVPHPWSDHRWMGFLDARTLLTESGGGSTRYVATDTSWPARREQITADHPLRSGVAESHRVPKVRLEHVLDAPVTLDQSRVASAAETEAVVSPNTTNGSSFDAQVASTGAIVVAGVPIDSQYGPNSGVAYTMDATSGKLIATMRSPEPGAMHFFGGSVAISPDVVVVSATGDVQGGVRGGLVFVFDAKTGTLMFPLASPKESGSSRFGVGVAVEGNHIVVSECCDIVSKTESGKLHVFDSTTGNHLRTIKNPTPDSIDRFGTCIALSGQLLVVGAPTDDELGMDSGIAYVCDVSTGELVSTLTHSHIRAGDQFGTSVAIHGTTAVVGAANGDTTFADGGRVYAFDALTGRLIATIANPEPQPGSGFGSQVAISPTAVAVSSTSDNSEGTNVGIVHAFHHNGSLLATFTNPLPNRKDYLGYSVALSDGLFVVGGRQHTATHEDGGSVSLFKPDARQFPWLPLTTDRK